MQVYLNKPSTFQYSRNHLGPFQTEKWREARRKEFSKLNRIGMRLNVKRSTMPKERRVLNTNGFLKSSVMEFSGQASSVWVHPNSWSWLQWSI